MELAIIELCINSTPQIVLCIALFFALIMTGILALIQLATSKDTNQIENEQKDSSFEPYCILCLLVSWLAFPILGGCIFIKKFIDKDQRGTMNFRRVIYFDIKRIEYFLGFISRMYILIYIDSVNFFIIFFAILNLIIAIVGTVYNYWRIIIKVEKHTKYRYIYMGIMFGVQHVGTGLYYVGFVRNYGWNILWYVLLCCPLHLALQYVLFRLYVNVSSESTGKYYGGDSKFYTSWKYMSVTMLSAAFTSFINPIHQVIWVSLGTTPLILKILPFFYWTVSLVVMFFMTIFADKPVVLIIALCFNAIAYGMTVFHAIYSSKMESGGCKIGNGVAQEDTFNKTLKGNHQALQMPKIKIKSIIHGMNRNQTLRDEHHDSQAKMNNE
mmetsp:Transcript_12271/g.13814  ORF Transcript_12271/g.13814 Transcript_12271/m.13814 type:complete len:383 (+) Transcript_12271:170-1318(+)